MNITSSIIATLSPEEKRNFITLLKQKNKRKDTKNILLFKLLDTRPNEKDLDVLIYKKKAKGAFHALCKRLHDSLIDFIAAKSFEGETSEEMEIMKLLLASRIFFEQKQYKIALKVIKKAEQKAKTYELYSILREVYYTKIQYAHVDNTLSLADTIQAFRDNQQALLQEENLNLFYATIQDHLKKPVKNTTQILQKSLTRFNISTTQGLTFKSLYKLLEITNQVAHVQRNFHTILPFIETTYQQIESKEMLTEKHLFYHIQILYYVANSYFRNKEFTTSSKYIEIMRLQMTKQHQKYEKRFLPQYSLLKALHLNYSGNADQAIHLLEKINTPKLKEQLSYLLHIQLTLIVLLFQQSRYKDALQLFRELHHSDTWYTEKAGIIWVIKKNLIEIILYIESNTIDLVISRTASFRKKHGKYLKNHNEQRVLDFLALATHFYYHHHSIDTDKFLTKIENTLLKNLPHQEDIFVMSFYAWLKAKVTSSNVYDTTLNILHQLP